MTDFEAFKSLFQFLEFENYPCKDWSISTSQNMAKATKDVVQKSKYISMNYDELTTNDNQIWLSIHVYVTEE